MGGLYLCNFLEHPRSHAAQLCPAHTLTYSPPLSRKQSSTKHLRRAPTHPHLVPLPPRPATAPVTVVTGGATSPWPLPRWRTSAAATSVAIVRREGAEVRREWKRTSTVRRWRRGWRVPAARITPSSHPNRLEQDTRTAWPPAAAPPSPAIAAGRHTRPTATATAATEQTPRHPAASTRAPAIPRGATANDRPLMAGNPCVAHPLTGGGRASPRPPPLHGRRRRRPTRPLPPPRRPPLWTSPRSRALAASVDRLSVACWARPAVVRAPPPPSGRTAAAAERTGSGVDDGRRGRPASALGVA